MVGGTESYVGAMDARRKGQERISTCIPLRISRVRLLSGVKLSVQQQRLVVACSATSSSSPFCFEFSPPPPPPPSTSSYLLTKAPFLSNPVGS